MRKRTRLSTVHEVGGQSDAPLLVMQNPRCRLTTAIAFVPVARAVIVLIVTDFVTDEIW